ncbi:BMP family lipoprotein [Paenibacillus tuaregi]|uniref:BMP family lipoprotein n=1 Tax=Paenibacillus tuaregi TaxID=1816681 RepID=UPI0008393591|nr:BMP family ABC transporter substrate-binding protein [Paenibacillus tuaregi]
MKQTVQTVWLRWLTAISAVVLLNACSTQPTHQAEQDLKKTKVGIMLSDVGLGDQSFSDAGFNGLAKARDEKRIIFDYRELQDTKTYEAGLEQLVQEDSQLVIGLGFAMKESMEKVAKKHPDRQFLLVDEKSELPNVASMTFKEEEGSYLAGVVAGLATHTGNIGFLGGVDNALIHKFEAGFRQGIKAVNPEANLTTAYAGDFGKADLGREFADEMIDKHDVDTIYAAAGFTGVGALQEAEKRKIHGIGVDTDQFFVAEKAVVTSMVKNVDVALNTAVKAFVDNQGHFKTKDMVFGIQEGGVGLAQIRAIQLSPGQMAAIEEQKQKLIKGSISVKTN